MKTALAAIPGVASCKIGLEANITAADYPLIRIVPTRLNPPTTGNTRRQVEVLIYCGVPRLEAHDGLETVYEELLTLEGQIVEALQFALVQAGITQGEFIEPQFIETVTDEDRLPHYKLFALRWRVEG
jgi:hypothetical protein